MLLWMLALVGFTFLAFVIPPLSYVIGLLALVLILAGLILPIIAAVKASGGESYDYPYTSHIFQ